MRGGRVAWRRGRLGAWAAAGKIGDFGSRHLRAKGTQEGEVKREGNRVFQPRGLVDVWDDLKSEKSSMLEFPT